MIHVPQHIDDQQNAAANVTQRIAPCRDLVDVPLLGDVGKQRLVKNVGSSKAYVTHDKENRGQDVGALAEHDE